MSPTDDLLQRAVAAGLLPPDARAPELESQPWPVLLLTALGAWLATLPLLGVVALLLGDLLTRSAGPYGVGLLLLGGAVVVLRARAVPLFVEQLAVPALLVGAGSLAFGLFRDLPDRGAALALAGVGLALVLAVPRAWLRSLLGVAIALLMGLALLPERHRFLFDDDTDRLWLVLHGLLALWAVALTVLLPRLAGAARAQTASALESTAPGWLLVTLAGLAWLAGMSFLVGGAMGPGLASDLAREAAWHRSQSDDLLLFARHAVSMGLAVLAALLAWRAWPPLRRPALAGVGLALVILAGLLPTLGGVLLALSLTATSRRWLQASAAAVAAAWIIGSFYYQLDWPLGYKAALLVGLGAGLGAMAVWLAREDRPAASERGPHAALGGRAAGRASWWVAAGSALPLLVGTVGIWQKERLIAQGQPVFVALAPVDPRSLMQGDYMRLNFLLSSDVWKVAPPGLAAQRPVVVLQRDAHGVGTVRQLDHPGRPLAADELRIELAPRNGSWALVTDAWYFKEGEAERWAAARYGEFRVSPSGQALLVGMADAELRPIRP